MSFLLQSTPLVPGQPIFTQGVQFSWATMLSWSDDERAAYGITWVSDPPTVPVSVTRLQGQLALNAAGLLASVEAAVAAADATTRIWYADAPNWQRNDAHLTALAAVLGLSSSQVDGLFVQAAAF